ncbi:hypothetical protein ACOMHN_004755 [Nucella lapillus]
MSDTESDYDPDNIGGSTSEESVHESEESSDSEDYSDEGDAASDESDAASGEEHGDQGDAVPAVGGVWLPVLGEDPGPAPIPFTAVPGPKHLPPPESKPIDYANLFFPPALVDKIVQETNLYARQWIETHQQHLRDHPRSMVHQWIKQGEASPDEFRAFLGLLVNMGPNRKNALRDYWMTSRPSQRTPWFAEHFSRDRFFLWLKFLHFNDNAHLPDQGHPDHKLYKLKPLIDHFQHVFLRLYHPGRDISLDESLIGYKGKTPHLRQYMPNKHHVRFGVKLWCVADPTNGYLSTFEVYKGGHNPEDTTGPEGVTYHLVMRLLETCRFLNLGHHLGLDNFFTSPALFRDLYAQHTTATGTARSNRKGLPKACIKTKLRSQEVCERRKGELLCVSYQDRSRKVTLLSTAASAGYMNTHNARGQHRRRPKIVVKYNKSMGGVDLCDSKLYCYCGERRTMKWTNKVAFGLFGRALLNAYILYDLHSSDIHKLTRKMFLVDVLESLAGGYYPPKVVRRRRTQAQIEADRAQPQVFAVPQPADPQPGPADPQPGPAGDAGHQLRKLPGSNRRNCVAGHDGRKRSRFECPACDIGLCPECFAQYHKKPRV